MEKFRRCGLKLTPQRLAILEYLDGNKEHPSADDVYQAVSKKFPTLSLATVYNTLFTLKQRGLVKELTIDPTRMRFDPQTTAHHHLICLHCRRIIDIDTKLDILLPEAESGGFEIVGNHVEFYGFCPKCKKKRHRINPD